MENKIDLFENGRVIAATRSDEEFLHAIDAQPEIIFDLDPDLINISRKVKSAHGAGKKYFLHIDLAKGLGKDESGIKYLKVLDVDGVISTKTSMIKLAREQGLLTVQRFFIVDSHSVQTTVEAAKASKATMIEIMPGTLPKVISRLKSCVEAPIIAGGLIETKAELQTILKHGASAISTGRKELWR